MQALKQATCAGADLHAYGSLSADPASQLPVVPGPAIPQHALSDPTTLQPDPTTLQPDAPALPPALQPFPAGMPAGEAGLVQHPEGFVIDIARLEEEASNADNKNWRKSEQRSDVKHGRFSAQEKALVRAVAEAYADAKGLGRDLSWLFNTRSGEQREMTRGAWRVIAAALPHRKVKAVWAAGTRMLNPGNYQARHPTCQRTRL